MVVDTDEMEELRKEVSPYLTCHTDMHAYLNGRQYIDGTPEEIKEKHARLCKLAYEQRLAEIG